MRCQERVFPDDPRTGDSSWMASSEVDQKFLGYFAKVTTTDNNYLSSFLFRTLGLSVILAEKLIRARRAKRLDPVRDPAARQLVHHILWLAREGLVMVEQYILPMVGKYVELQVLSHKLRASFYHIFVLFHNEPAVNDRINRSWSAAGAAWFPDPLSPARAAKSPTPAPPTPTRTPLRSPGAGGRTGRRQRSPAISLGGPVGGAMRTPPGLPRPTVPYWNDNDDNDDDGDGDGTAPFLLPLQDYTPEATRAFHEANDLAERLLPGSHPVRLSVKVEYVAYVYDCLHEAERSRGLARVSIRHVYEAQEGMDDDSFEDAAEMVDILRKMMKRGLAGAESTVSGGVPGRRDPRPPRASASASTQHPTTWV